MAYDSEALPGFGAGLDLVSKTDVVDSSAAIDCLNVLFATRGAVEQRDGYAEFTTSEGTNRYDSLVPFYTASGTRRLIGGAGNRLEAVGSDGVLVGSGHTSTAPTASPHYFARWGGYTGTQTAEYVYTANGTDTLRRYDATSGWTTPSYVDQAANAVAPKGKFVAGWPASNRLLCGNTPTPTNGDTGPRPSRIEISDPGNPLVWGDNNFIEVTPGDGEQIMQMIAWRDLVYIFKESKFFALYGESVDDNANPVFERRPIDAGIGLVSSRAACASRDGVYFLDRRGVYRTDGFNDPQLVSRAIEPFFLGGTSAYWRSGELNQGAISSAVMTSFDERIYLAVPTGSSTTNNLMLVYDPRYGWWSAYDIPAAAMSTFRISTTGRAELVFSYAIGEKHIGRHQGDPLRGFAADDVEPDGSGGTAIKSRWRSGWFDANDTDEKEIREAKTWGAGSVQIAVSTDFGISPGEPKAIIFSGGADTWGDGTNASDKWASGITSDIWGPANAIVEATVREAVNRRGQVFSLYLTNTALRKSWAMHRFVLHYRPQLRKSRTKVDS